MAKLITPDIVVKKSTALCIAGICSVEVPKKLWKDIEDLPKEIRGISNIYRPLELILMGTAFEVSALVLLDALVAELMQSLNLREKDLKSYHDVLSSSI